MVSTALLVFFMVLHGICAGASLAALSKDVLPRGDAKRPTRRAAVFHLLYELAIALACVWALLVEGRVQ
ncbi:hypothetical protein [Caldimonas sp. KR1-144]|uniref:hypothetical protein n=1 Tax=Caldimonas sp. KR1-144 TaxID=3400911 RepID=UPI003C0B8F47